MRNPSLATVAAASVFLVAGCTVGPDYERPELPELESYRFGQDLPDTASALDPADTEWWTGFNDPALNALVTEALQNNLDVRIAAARVEQFAAVIGLTRSQAFPQVGYDAGAARQQSSREVNPAGPRVSDFFEANLNVGWELDVFGRIRNATDAALADTLAAEEVRRGVILTVVTSVATSYIGLRSLDEQLAISRAKLQTRRETTDLFQLQYERGIISRLELAQIQSELERTAATIPAIEREIGQLENALSVLLGRPPGQIPRGVTLAALAAPPIPGGLPSDLLLRRPDLREAEQRLISTNELIGVAVAEYYPSFNLTASLGLASSDLTNLFDNTAVTYGLGAGLLGPIFTSGFLESQLEQAKAAEREAIELYRSAVLTAFRESEDALVVRSTTIDEAAAQSRQVAALAKYAELAQKRYDNGFVDYLEVLDAERDLFDAELERAQLRAAELSAVIGIYKAFGGGWVEIAEDFAQPEDESQDADSTDSTETADAGAQAEAS
ncbi:MAG: efflux transporter outer membrane subunit [Planctomycetota bacterium]